MYLKWQPGEKLVIFIKKKKINKESQCVLAFSPVSLETQYSSLCPTIPCNSNRWLMVLLSPGDFSVTVHWFLILILWNHNCSLHCERRSIQICLVFYLLSYKAPYVLPNILLASIQKQHHIFSVIRGWWTKHRLTEQKRSSTIIIVIKSMRVTRGEVNKISII